MNTQLALAGSATAGVGVLLLFVQYLSTRRHFQRARVRPHVHDTPGISILKPLCGLDDELAENLTSFARLDYPRFEVLLGVRSRGDAAYPVALACVERWPHLFRLVLQRGEPGLNPKVNQLITLQRAARHPIVVISDSNIRVRPDYLHDIAAQLADPAVGLVSHPIAGAGEARLGALLDNLHLTCQIGPGVVAAQRVADRDIVVGKSMALRQRDLATLGGFEVMKDVLAEDYFLGRAVNQQLGLRCALGARPVTNVSATRTVGDFVQRYQRWAVIHRQAVGTLVYACEVFLNPLAFAVLALLLHPALCTVTAGVAVWLCKTLLDEASARSFRGHGVGRWAPVVVAFKDGLLFTAWVHGLFVSTVKWRGTRLRVHPGTRLERPASLAATTLTQEVYE